ncbi:TRAP transporter small permease [Roseovarius aestuarii]|uniref:TRAP transporter small permease protein n=1 Tax=Roseovarius aestuarii TaxID=475083 RepID=A0A1X7BLC1_9RHOB|nr:TRAP transporter small permease subunit [Roseovarius aestuarii]SMC10442.1 Tripartite ATP-independent periplasmic transporters, DctQ component [Roseovarius aestuarii]
MSIWSDIVTIITATLSGDINFKVVQAYRSEAAWFVFGPLTAIGAVLTYFLYKKAPWIDRNFERAVIVYTYIIIALIIFVGVIQRFVFSSQVPWSTTIPPLLFMIMAWYGCSYNVRLRTHLSFNEFRTKMGRSGQLTCLMLDNVLWFIFCIIVVTTTARVTVNTYDNFAIVLGTDNVMRWWFLVTMPLCFIMMAGRVLENTIEDLTNFRTGKPLINQAVIGGDV